MEKNRDHNYSGEENSLSKVKEAINKVNQRFVESMAKSDAAGVADCYWEDAEFMAPGAPSIIGRENIKTTMQGYISQGITEYTVVSTIVYNNGPVAGVQEAYTLSKPGGADKDVGKSIQLWKKENDEWKIYRDCFNSDLTGS